MSDRSAEPQVKIPPYPSAIASPEPTQAPGRRLALVVQVSGFLLGMLVTALAALLLWLLFTFSDKQVTRRLTEFAQQEYGRSFALEGGEGAKLVLRPLPQLQVGAASLSEPYRQEAFARWQQARFQLDLMALLERRLVIRHARIQGLTVRLAKDEQGTWNAADLLEPGSDDAPLRLELDGLELQRSQVVVDDTRSKQRLQWREVALKTDALRPASGGRLQLGAQLVTPDEALRGRIELSARYRLGQQASELTLGGVDGSYAGDIRGFGTAQLGLTAVAANWQGGKLRVQDAQVRGTAKRGDLLLELVTAVPTASWQDGALAANATAQLDFRPTTQADGPRGRLSLTLQDLARTGTGAYRARLGAIGHVQAGERNADGRLDLHVRYEEDGQRLGSDDIAGVMTVTHPMLRAPNTPITVRGGGQWSLAGATEVPLKLDLSVTAASQHARLTAQLPARGSGPLRLTGALESQALDLDAVLAPPRSWAALPSAQALSGWALDASVKADSLRIMGARLASVDLPIKVREGRIELPEHSARLYGGRLSGSATYDAGKPAVTLYEALREVAIGDLARDAKIDLPLSGMANATLEARSVSDAPAKLLDAADGVLRVFVRDARWRGTDLPAHMLALRTGQPAPSAADASTPFAEISGAFGINGRKLKTQRLSAQGKVVSASASGEIDYADGKMDLQLDARPGADRSLAPLAGKAMSLRAQGGVLQPAITLRSAQAAAPPVMASH